MAQADLTRHTFLDVLPGSDLSLAVFPFCVSLESASSSCLRACARCRRLFVYPVEMCEDTLGVLIVDQIMYIRALGT